MTLKFGSMFDPRWIAASAAVAVGLWTASYAAAQIAPAINAAQDAAQGATSTADNAAQGAASTAQNAAQGAASTAQNAAQGAASTTQNAAQGAANAAQGAAQGAANTAAGAAQSTRDTVRDATRDARDVSRDTLQDARDSARDINQRARDTSRDLRQDSRDITRDARDAASDVRDTARGTARDVINDTRGSVRANMRGSARANAFSEFRGADLGVWFDGSARDGLVIADVATDAALAQVGFREGDRIVSVSGRTVANEADFVRYLMADGVRDRVPIVVMRDGREMPLYIDPVVLRQRVTTVPVDPLENFGIILDDRFNDRIVVWRVIPRSPAFYSGIRPGDVITTFAGQQVLAPTAFAQVVERTNPGMVPIQVTRNGRVRTIQADFPEVQVSEQRSLRQDLDVDTRTDINAGQDLNINSRSTVEGNLSAPIPAGDLQRTRPANENVPPPRRDTGDTGDLQRTPGTTPSYNPDSGSGTSGRRGVFRRRR